MYIHIRMPYVCKTLGPNETIVSVVFLFARMHELHTVNCFQFSQLIIIIIKLEKSKGTLHSKHHIVYGSILSYYLLSMLIWTRHVMLTFWLLGTIMGYFSFQLSIIVNKVRECTYTLLKSCFYLSFSQTNIFLVNKNIMSLSPYTVCYRLIEKMRIVHYAMFISHVHDTTKYTH